MVNDQPRLLTIDVTSDPICGFSYIAYRRIKLALNKLVQEQSNIKAVIRHHPYILDPRLPENELVWRSSCLRRDLGENSVQLWQGIIEQGLSCEISFAADGKIGQTIYAQRLLLHALRTLGAGAQFQLLGLIFQHEFDLQQDIFSAEPLSKLAAVPIPCSDGVSRPLFASQQEALEWLESGELRSELVMSAKKAREHGIKAIPFLVLNGKYAICGAQEEDVYLDSFRKAVQ